MKFEIQAQALADVIGNEAKETVVNIQSQLQWAYELGRDDKAREVRECLGMDGE